MALFHMSDSNEGSDYIVIFLSFISGFLGQHLKSKLCNQWKINVVLRNQKSKKEKCRCSQSLHLNPACVFRRRF